MNYLHILNISPLSVTSLANIFSHFIGCIFVLLMVSFATQRLISLIRSHLFIFAFISFALGDKPQKQSYDLCQRVFCLHFLLGVLPLGFGFGLTFKSLIHFEFILYDIRECSEK